MNIFIKHLSIFFLNIWAKSGVAPGLFHKYLDKTLPQFSKIKKYKRLLDNNIMFCDLSDHVQGRIYFMGVYEPIETFLFTSLMDKDSLIIDGGANVGSYTLFSASKAINGQVYAFEPVDKNYKILLNNIKLSDKKNITPIRKGLWHKKDVLSFSLEPRFVNNAGSFTAGPVTNFETQTTCEVTSIDEFVVESNLKKVDFIKLDIEGAELFALRGAEQTIKKYQPTILLEVNKTACNQFGYKPQDLFEFLNKFKYKVFKIESIPTQSGFIDNFDNLTQVNVLLISEKMLSKLETNWNYKKIKKHYMRSGSI